MTEAEKVDAVETAMGESPPETPKEVSVAWDDFLKVCVERGIEYVEGKTVLQMKEDFLSNLDKVEPDSAEEEALSQELVDIQAALVDGAPIIGSPEDANPKTGKKAKKEKKEKVKKEKVAKEPKPKKEKVKKETKSKLGGIGMKPMCRELFGEMTKEQVKAAEPEIKKKLAQVYVDAGLGDEAYGLGRANRIFYDIHVEKFNEPPFVKEKAIPVPKKEKVKKEKKKKDKNGDSGGPPTEEPGTIVKPPEEGSE